MNCNSMHSFRSMSKVKSKGTTWVKQGRVWFPQQKFHLSITPPFFNITHWYFTYMLIDIMFSNDRNDRIWNAEGGFRHSFLLWLLNSHVFHNKNFAIGSEMQRWNFSIHFCDGLLNSHVFHNKNFADPLLLHFSILHLDISHTCLLIY